MLPHKGCSCAAWLLAFIDVLFGNQHINAGLRVITDFMFMFALPRVDAMVPKIPGTLPTFSPANWITATSSVKEMLFTTPWVMQESAEITVSGLLAD